MNQKETLVSEEEKNLRKLNSVCRNGILFARSMKRSKNKLQIANRM
jgi:hypothetical protein